MLGVQERSRRGSIDLGTLGAQDRFTLPQELPPHRFTLPQDAVSKGSRRNSTDGTLLLPNLSPPGAGGSSRPSSARSGRPRSARSARSSIESGASARLPDTDTKLPHIKVDFKGSKANMTLKDYTDLSIEVLHTVEAFNKTKLHMKLEARLLKQLSSQPPLKQVNTIKDIFFQVSAVSGLGANTFPLNFLEEIGIVRSISVRFIRTVVALVFTALDKPKETWPTAETIFEDVREQLKLMQELAQAASDREAILRFEEAREVAKEVLTKVSLSERKEEREAARMKRMAKMKNMGPSGGASGKVPVQKKAKHAGSLVGLGRKGTMTSEDGQDLDVDPESIYELDDEELEQEVSDKVQMMVHAIKDDDVETVMLDIRHLNKTLRKKEPMRQSKDWPFGGWRAAVTNMKRIREKNTQQVILAALSHRDDHSEVLLHKVKSLEMYRVLLKHNKDAENATNWDGQRPLQVYTNSCTEDIDKIQSLAQQDIRQMLILDGDSVSTCMRLGRDGRNIVERYFSVWDDLLKALRSPHPVAALKKEIMPENSWAEVLHYHLFHEHQVWEKGRMSHTAYTRLLEVWRAIRDTLQKIADRNKGEAELKHAKHALHDVKELLNATKGPRTLDARQPYRDELTRLMTQLQLQSQQVLEDFYSSLEGTAAEELQGIPSGLHPDIIPDTLVKKTGIQMSLRMDYDLVYTETHADERAGGDPDASRVVKLDPPPWCFAKSPAEVKKEVLEDLERVGMIEKDGNEQHQLIKLAVGGSGQEADDDYHFQTLHWYAAWLRGVCQVNGKYIHDRMMEALGALDPEEGYKGETGNISFRKEAKGFPRICEKTRERMAEIREEIQSIRERDNREITVDDHLKLLMSQTAAYICDIAGCTFIADDPEEALAAFGAMSGLVRPDLRDERLSSVLLLRDEHRLRQGFLVCDNFRTSDYFEVSFELCLLAPRDDAPTVGPASVVQFEAEGAFLPAVYIVGGNLCAIVGRPGKFITCVAKEELEPEKIVAVVVRLTGMAFSIEFDGRQVGTTTTGPRMAPGKLGVAVFAGAEGKPAADAEVSMLKYKALDIHGKVLQWHMIRGAVQPILKRERFAIPPLGEDAPLESWGDGRCQTRVLRVKNLFNKEAQSAGGYRDLKMWVAIETPAGPLLAEVQLLLRPAFDEKKWMHLPYEYFRGSLDWGEYKPEPVQDEENEGNFLGAVAAKGANLQSDLSPADEDMLLSSLHAVCALMYLKNSGGLDLGRQMTGPVA